MKKMRIMKKNYHVVNKTTGEKMIVYPARKPGLNRDKKDAMTEHGEWLRLYDIVDTNGVDATTFDSVRPDGVDSNSIVLYNASGLVPYVVVNGQRWELEPIPGVVSRKPRSKSKKKVIVDASPVADATEDNEEKTEDTVSGCEDNEQVSSYFE